MAEKHLTVLQFNSEALIECINSICSRFPKGTEGRGKQIRVNPGQGKQGTWVLDVILPIAHQLVFLFKSCVSPSRLEFSIPLKQRDWIR